MVLEVIYENATHDEEPKSVEIVLERATEVRLNGRLQVVHGRKVLVLVPKGAKVYAGKGVKVLHLESRPTTKKKYFKN